MCYTVRQIDFAVAELVAALLSAQAKAQLALDISHKNLTAFIEHRYPLPSGL